MTLGAFISLGVPPERLERELSRVLSREIKLSVASISRGGISARGVQVNAGDDRASRNYSRIKQLIKKSDLNPRVKTISLDIFDKIAVAEGEIHGCAPDDVHFHEVGGLDAIVDIVGTAICVDYLGLEKMMSAPIPLGKGFLSCRHGVLPVPAPATLAILKDIPVYGSGIGHELVTPTGAAIIAVLADSFQDIPEMTIEKIGYGAGERELEEIPNLLRIITGRLKKGDLSRLEGALQETVGVVETCIDDMNPELLGFTVERLYADGALDVYLFPIYMKKNRPGTMLQVLCRVERKTVMAQRILTETTSLGVRVYDIRRFALFREPVILETPFGRVQAKRIRDLSGNLRVVPEYDACRKIALEKKIALQVVYETIEKNPGPVITEGNDRERN